MDKNQFALTPPMGWNSYDYYNTSADEESVKANADYMAKNLKEYGWEYVVVDIEWYSCHGKRRNDEFQYIPFEKVALDEYSRLLPCLERFPSAANGAGFKPLADYVHSLGLKFGIHIMRGIPRYAAHMHMPILGTDVTADKIADHNSICAWNPDMYGVYPFKEASQLYYDSIFALYAQWGVDFVKCDDICRMDMPSAKPEIVMLHKAIQKCGRPIVLSLSPGAAKIEEAWHYEKYANMWRITDDFWDEWHLLYNMFERCEVWEKHVSQGNYPDCDMLPIGKLGGWHNGEWDCRFTKDEQITMMTLWCIFKSPLMIGADLPQLDDWTLSLLTNKDVLHTLFLKAQARQLERNEAYAIWTNYDEDGTRYIALFNMKNEVQDITFDANAYGICMEGKTTATELWTKENVAVENGVIKMSVAAHGAVMVRV